MRVIVIWLEGVLAVKMGLDCWDSSMEESMSLGGFDCKEW